MYMYLCNYGFKILNFVFQRKDTLSPAQTSNIQRVYKVVFVGDSGVGKSSFIHRYCYEIWKPSYTATIGTLWCGLISTVVILRAFYQ